MDLLEFLNYLENYNLSDEILLSIDPNYYKNLMNISEHANEKYQNKQFFSGYYQRHVRTEEIIDDIYKRITSYLGSVKYGQEQRFVHDKLAKLIQWKDGFKDGIEENYFWYVNKGIKRRKYWNFGKLEKEEHYYDDGKIRTSIEWTSQWDGRSWKHLKQGEEKEYFSDGSLYVIKRWKNGVKDGLEESFHDNGSINNIKQWENGVIHGSDRYFHKAEIIKSSTEKTIPPVYAESRLSSITRYNHGKLNGDQENFGSNGFRYFFKHWDDNIPNGIEEEWYNYGRAKKYMFLWENGKVIKQEHY